jgi:hypothetical protein
MEEHKQAHAVAKEDTPETALVFFDNPQLRIERGETLNIKELRYSLALLVTKYWPAPPQLGLSPHVTLCELGKDTPFKFLRAIERDEAFVELAMCPQLSIHTTGRVKGLARGMFVSLNPDWWIGALKERILSLKEAWETEHPSEPPISCEFRPLHVTIAPTRVHNYSPLTFAHLDLGCELRPNINYQTRAARSHIKKRANSIVTFNKCLIAFNLFTHWHALSREAFSIVSRRSTVPSRSTGAAFEYPAVQWDKATQSTMGLFKMAPRLDGIDEDTFLKSMEIAGEILGYMCTKCGPLYCNDCYVP